MLYKLLCCMLLYTKYKYLLLRRRSEKASCPLHCGLSWRDLFMKKKLLCLLLAAVGSFVFALSAGAEGVSVSDAPPAAEQSQSAAERFGGSLRLVYDSAPTNKAVTVAVAVDNATLAEGDVIRCRMFSDAVSGADAAQWFDYTAPFEVPDNMKVEAKVVFADGSASFPASASIGFIDKTPPAAPEIASSNTEWTRDPVTVTLSGGSDEQSGLLRLEYRLGAEGAWTEYTGAVSIAAPTAVYARSVDAAGNMSAASLLEITNFDTTAPDVAAMSVGLSADGSPVVGEQGAFSKYFGSDVTVSIDGAADAASGIKGYQYQTVEGAESPKEDKWQTYDPAKPPVISGDFCGYVYARAVDNVGNTSAPVASEGFIIDVTPPVVENIKLSETAITGNRVIVTFNVKDNYWVETVTVNGVYAGIYISAFTAFRNDDYLIVAYDKVGNRTEQLVQITNINATPFTLLDTFKGMKAEDFTPTTWAAAEKAAAELEGLITVDAPQAQIEASAGRLLTALEGLVTRGDNTLSLELIERIAAYDPAAYTESSWNLLVEGIAQLRAVLNDPESTQESVDNGRRALEQRVTELVKRADFTNLDRLIAQCERMDTKNFGGESYTLFTEALTAAKELSRTDSGQDAADEAYRALLDAMGGLEVQEEKSFEIAPVATVIVGLLIVAVGIALFIVKTRLNSRVSALKADDSDFDDDNNDLGGCGDIRFTDEETAPDITFSENKDEPYIGGTDRSDYIGRR